METRVKWADRSSEFSALRCSGTFCQSSKDSVVVPVLRYVRHSNPASFDDQLKHTTISSKILSAPQAWKSSAGDSAQAVPWTGGLSAKSIAEKVCAQICSKRISLGEFGTC